MFASCCLLLLFASRRAREWRVQQVQAEYLLEPFNVQDTSPDLKCQLFVLKRVNSQYSLERAGSHIVVCPRFQLVESLKYYNKCHELMHPETMQKGLCNHLETPVLQALCLRYLSFTTCPSRHFYLP